MGIFIKIVWSIISIIPILLVFFVLCFVDFLSLQILFKSVWWGIAIIIACAAFSLLLPVILLIAKKNLALHALNIIEVEAKDSELAPGLISYLLPLITLSLKDLNLYVFIAMLIVVLLLLIFTRIITFNPLMYFLGYRYYKVKTTSGTCYTVLSRRKKYNHQASAGYVEIFNEIYLEV